MSQYNPTSKKIYHASVNACLAPLVSLDGKHVITVEGIGNVKKPHPVQERIAMGSGSQCGFCTPGIVMVHSLFFCSCTPLMCYRACMLYCVITLILLSMRLKRPLMGIFVAAPDIDQYSTQHTLLAQKPSVLDRRQMMAKDVVWTKVVQVMEMVVTRVPQ